MLALGDSGRLSLQVAAFLVSRRDRGCVAASRLRVWGRPEELSSRGMLVGVYALVGGCARVLHA